MSDKDMAGARAYMDMHANQGYDWDSTSWAFGTPWQISAPVAFPRFAEFDEGIMSVALYFSATLTQGSVVLFRSFVSDGQAVDNISWESVGDPALPLEGYKPDILQRIALGSFPLKRGEGGVYIVTRDFIDLEDTAASEDAIQIWALEFVVSGGEMILAFTFWFWLGVIGGLVSLLLLLAAAIVEEGR